MPISFDEAGQVREAVTCTSAWARYPRNLCQGTTALTEELASRKDTLPR